MTYRCACVNKMLTLVRASIASVIRPSEEQRMQPALARELPTYARKVWLDVMYKSEKVRLLRDFGRKPLDLKENTTTLQAVQSRRG